MRDALSTVICSVLVMAMALTISAEVPQTISYQGCLTDDTGAPVPDGDYNLTFQIVEHDPLPMGESPLWSSGMQTVSTTDGLFVYYLGSNVPLPSSVFTDDGLDSHYLRFALEGASLFSTGVRMATVPFAFKAVSADTADYALSGPGGGASGWVDDGSVVRLDNAGDLVGIGTATPNEWLVVGKDMGNLYGDFVVAGNPAVDGKTGFTAGYDIDNRGWFSWDNEEKEFQIGIRSNGTNTPNSIYLANGKVGIGQPYPTEDLVVGNNLGTFDGKCIGVGDGTPGAQTGLVFGKDNQNRAWLLWDIDNKLAALGTVESDTAYNNTIVLKGGKVGIGNANPQFSLDIQDRSAAIRLRSTDNTEPTIGFGNPFLSLWTMRYSPGLHRFVIYNEIDDENAITITDDRSRVGIGTVSSTYALDVAGNIECTSLIETSDRRYKTNITPIGKTLDKVTKLQGIRFNWKKESYPEQKFSDKQQVGLIAQDLREIFPELVSGDNNGVLTISYSKFAPILVEAIKELKAENDILRSELNEISSILNNRTLDDKN